MLRRGFLKTSAAVSVALSATPLHAATELPAPKPTALRFIEPVQMVFTGGGLKDGNVMMFGRFLTNGGICYKSFPEKELGFACEFHLNIGDRLLFVDHPFPQRNGVWIYEGGNDCCRDLSPAELIEPGEMLGVVMKNDFGPEERTYLQIQPPMISNKAAQVWIQV